MKQKSAWEPFEIVSPDDHDYRHGWTVSTRTLAAIQERIRDEGFEVPGWEEIESVLIVITGVKRNPNAKRTMDA